MGCVIKFTQLMMAFPLSCLCQQLWRQDGVQLSWTTSHPLQQKSTSACPHIAKLFNDGAWAFHVNPKIHPDETEPLIWIWHRAINHVFQNSRPKIIICHRTVPSICSTRLLSNLRTVDLLALNKGSLKAGRFWKKLVLQESQSCLVLPPHIDSHLFLPTVISWDTPFPDSSKLAVCLYYKLISCVVQGIFKPSKL